MSRRAYAEMVIERRLLTVPAERRKVRMDLYEQLSTLGRVDHVERYVQDPPDGPFRDPAYHLGAVDFDRFAVIRIVGLVTPLTQEAAQLP